MDYSLPIIVLISFVVAGLAIMGLLTLGGSISLEGLESQNDVEKLNLNQMLRYAILAMGLYIGATALIELPENVCHCVGFHDPTEYIYALHDVCILDTIDVYYHSNCGGVYLYHQI